MTIQQKKYEDKDNAIVCAFGFIETLFGIL